jgi:hypothetical protein
VIRNNLWLLRYPIGILLGFAMQAWYMPGTTSSRMEGLVGILSITIGACAAYWRWYR